MEQLLSFVGDNPNLEMDSAILDKMYDYWTQKRIKEIVHLEETGVSVEAGAKLSILKAISASCKGILKAGDESKVTIRKEIEPRLSILIGMMNDLVSDINRQLQQTCNKELLVIIEDMDKIDIEEARHLFVLHRRPLVSLKMKMIISFPIHMVYTADFRLLQDDFDKCVLYSMIKVNNSDYSRYEPGIEVMKQIVERRMNWRNL